jgi:hypothetical protein
VAVGDFTGDGKLDLAVADFGDALGNGGGVSVLLGNGDGTFQPAVNYAAGSGPASVAVKDFNGDGSLDLAVADNQGSTLSVLLGNGDGTFQTAGSYGAGSYPLSVAVGDFTGDGIPDLALANNGANNVSILLNDGVWPPGPGGSPRRQPPTSPAMGSTSSDRIPGFVGDVFRKAPSGSSALLRPGVNIYDTDPALASWLQPARDHPRTDDSFTCAADRTTGDGVPLLDGATVTGSGGDTTNGNELLTLMDSDGQDNIRGFNLNSISGGL